MMSVPDIVLIRLSLFPVELNWTRGPWMTVVASGN